MVENINEENQSGKKTNEEAEVNDPIKETEVNDFFKKTDNVHNIENTITDTQFLNEPDVIEFFEKTISESNKKKRTHSCQVLNFISVK